MKFNRTRWATQGLPAALFLLAGAMKLGLAFDDLSGSMALPGPFLRFIGGAEVLGALGLVLPCLLRSQPVLMPIAAGGLLIIVTGALGITTIGGSLIGAIVPLIVRVALMAVA